MPRAAAHRPGTRARLLLTLACAGVLLAAADTYVVVLALTDMMAGVGLGIESLQRATPIVSGFLLGYVAVLPLVGRLSDLLDRRRVILGCLLVFVAGAVVTALAVELGVLVGGRFLQGVGGGGLVPATLALVADLWPAEQRGTPLGVVGAVQELGAVAGPIVGAAVLVVTDWRGIFWLMGLAALVLYAALRALPAHLGAPSEHPPALDAGSADSSGSSGSSGSAGSAGSSASSGSSGSAGTAGTAIPAPPAALGRSGPARWARGLLTAVAAALAVLTLAAPARLVDDVTLGLPFVPFGSSTSRVATPIAAVTAALVVGLAAYRAWRSRAVLARCDLLGAALVAVALGSVILTFSTSQPEREVVGPMGLWLLPLGAVAAALAAWRVRTAAQPLVPPAVLRGPTLRAALVSLAVGVALVAVVVDVPLLARLTHTDSQAEAAFVLLRFLGPVPVGALVGGWLLRAAGAGVVAAAGLMAATAGLAAMSRWSAGVLAEAQSWWWLGLVGLALGLTLAPVNAAALAPLRHDEHGVASSVVVVARMMGMVVGLALLTAVGLRRYYQRVAELADPTDQQALVATAVVQVQVVFLGAAVAAGVGALLALGLGLRRPPGAARP